MVLKPKLQLVLVYMDQKLALSLGSRINVLQAKIFVIWGCLDSRHNPKDFSEMEQSYSHSQSSCHQQWTDISLNQNLFGQEGFLYLNF